MFWKEFEYYETDAHSYYFGKVETWESYDLFAGKDKNLNEREYFLKKRRSNKPMGIRILFELGRRGDVALYADDTTATARNRYNYRIVFKKMKPCPPPKTFTALDYLKRMFHKASSYTKNPDSNHTLTLGDYVAADILGGKGDANAALFVTEIMGIDASKPLPPRVKKNHRLDLLLAFQAYKGKESAMESLLNLKMVKNNHFGESTDDVMYLFVKAGRRKLVEKFIGRMGCYSDHMGFLRWANKPFIKEMLMNPEVFSEYPDSRANDGKVIKGALFEDYYELVLGFNCIKAAGNILKIAIQDRSYYSSAKEALVQLLGKPYPEIVDDLSRR